MQYIQRDCDKAAEWALRISHLSPSSLNEALYTLQCYKFSKKYEKAEEFFGKFRLPDPKRFGSKTLSSCLGMRTTMAEIYLEKGELRKALKEFERSISLLEVAVVSVPPDMMFYLKGSDAENYLADMTSFKMWEIMTLKDKLSELKKTIK
jgi:hypothetical protein